MQWPAEIVDAFSKVPMEPGIGLTKKGVIQYMLDESAKRAVGRAQADTNVLAVAYSQSYTPLGAVSIELGVEGKAKSITFDERWCEAVDALYAYVRKNPQLICDSFRNEQKPWPWDF